MIKFYKFRQEFFAPAPAREILHKPGNRGGGKGWPEECPPISGANGFGYDLLANFDLDFRYFPGRGGRWILQNPRTIASDFDWSPDDPRLPELAERTDRWLAARETGAGRTTPPRRQPAVISGWRRSTSPSLPWTSARVWSSSSCLPDGRWWNL